jgi:hypothetical protein
MKCIPVGARRVDDITAIWVDHLKEAVSLWEAKP